MLSIASLSCWFRVLKCHSFSPSQRMLTILCPFVPFPCCSCQLFKYIIHCMTHSQCFFPSSMQSVSCKKKSTVSHNREFWLFPHLWNWSGLSGQQLIRFGICIVDDAAASKRFAALAALEHLSMLLKLHVQFCFCVFFICLFFLNRVTVVAVASNVLYAAFGRLLVRGISASSYRTSTVRDLWVPFIARPFRLWGKNG